MESLSDKVADFKACNIIKKRLQHRCFPVNIAKSLRASILKIICKWLLLPLEVFCKEFVDIIYDNVSLAIQEDSIWLQLIYFLTTTTFWYMKRFSNTLCSIYRSNTLLWKIHDIAQVNFDCFVIDESNQVKFSCAIMWCQGYFLKIALGGRLFPIYLKK